MAFLYGFALLLTLILLVCVTVLTIVLFPWRKHPSLAPVFNFKSASWIALFVSIGIILLGFIGGELVSLLFPDPKGLSCVPFLLVMLVGVFCSLVSLILCLWTFVAAILSYVRTRQNKKTLISSSGNPHN